MTEKNQNVGDELEAALQVADEAVSALEGVKAVLDAYVTAAEELKATHKAELEKVRAEAGMAGSSPDMVAAEEKADALLQRLRDLKDRAAAMALHNTEADANSDQEAQPITVPSDIPGQPGTTYPDGKPRPPFDAPDSNPDMSSPRPQGSDPHKPE
jgi:hypothetical protein